MGKVIIVGGGAAGMMAAYSAGMCGHTVILLEKNGAYSILAVVL